MSDPVPPPVKEAGCAICNFAKAYAVPLIVAGVVAYFVWNYYKTKETGK